MINYFQIIFNIGLRGATLGGKFLLVFVLAKYLNSSDNAIFNKGNILYNFSDAKTEIKKANFVYLFEGFMDVIALHKVGIDNTVAIMGTSLTDNQIKLIQSVTNTVVLSLDGDEAGIHDHSHPADAILRQADCQGAVRQGAGKGD